MRPKKDANHDVPMPTEHEEQKALIHWAKVAVRQYPELRLLYAIPNGGKRHVGVARKLKAEGVQSGVPDLCLPVPRGTYCGLYIEMKRKKGGTVTAEQKEWIELLTDQRYRAVVCHGWLSACDEIQAYLRIGG